VSKCRAVLGPAFAGDRAGRDGRVELGRLRKRSEAECSACRVGWAGLVMSKGGKRASMVALPQPAANGSLCGCGSIAGSSGWLRKRSEAECGACGCFFIRKKKGIQDFCCNGLAKNEIYV